MHHHKTLRVLSAGVAVAIAAGCFSMLPALAASETALAPGSSSYAAPSQDKLMEYITQLCGTDSYATGSLYGSHGTGTPEDKQVAEWYQSQFESFNPDLDTRVIEQKNIGNDVTMHRLTIEGEQYPVYGINRGPSINILKDSYNGTAQIVYCKKGAAEDVPDSVSGKIALVDRSEPIGAFDMETISAGDLWNQTQKLNNATQAEKDAVANIKAKGAIGVIFACSNAGAFSNGFDQMKDLGGVLGNDFPGMVMQKSYGDVLKKHENQNISFDTVNCNQTWTTEAKLNPKSGQKADGIMLVTAHHDSAYGGPGANDNGSGAAMLMEMARLYANVDSNLEIRFVAFGGEEQGCRGSKAYLNSLSQEEKDSIICVLNTDEVATDRADWNYLSAEVVDGKLNLSASLMTGAMDELLNENELANDTAYRIYKFGSTDHEPFANAGIDACGFFRGNKNEDSEPRNHSELDTVDENIDPDRLMDAAQIWSKAISKAIDAHPAVKPDLDFVHTNDGLQVVVKNSEQFTKLFDVMHLEATGDSQEKLDFKVSKNRLAEGQDYVFELPEDGTYKLHLYTTGTGLTNLGNAHGEKRATDEYQQDLGEYTVYSGSSITNLDTEGPDYSGNVLMAMSTDYPTEMTDHASTGNPMRNTGIVPTEENSVSEHMSTDETEDTRCKTPELDAEAMQTLQKNVFEAGAKHTTPANYKKGDKITLNIWRSYNGQSGNVEFEVAYAGKSCVLWRETARPGDLTDEQAEIMGKKFDDSNAYAELEEIYGSDVLDRTDVDHDNKISFVFYEDNYADGYYDWGKSGGGKLDCVNMCTGIPGSKADYNSEQKRNYVMGVAVHEFMHLYTGGFVSGTGNPYEAWLNELVSQQAVKLTGINPEVLKGDVDYSHDYYQHNHYTTPFICAAGGPAYGMWYLFGRYLTLQTKGYDGGGEQLFATMLKKRHVALDTLKRTLTEIGYMGEGKEVANFDEIVRNFNIALYAQEIEGTFGFNGENVFFDPNTIDPTDSPVKRIPSGGSATFYKMPRTFAATSSGTDAKVSLTSFTDTSFHVPDVADSGLIADQPNLATDATPKASYTNPYSDGVGSLNDGKYDEGNSKGTTYASWNSWGQGQWTQNVTYTWDSPVTINATDVMFWYDGSGVDLPTGYRLDYRDQNGEWKSVENGAGYTLAANTFNLTTFDTITTTALKLTLYRDWSNYDGVGIYEWRVYEASPVESLTLQSKPKKLNYEVGDRLQLPGLMVQAKYQNGYIKTITKKFDISEVDMETPGTKTITVSYGGKTVSFDITVEEPTVTNLAIKTPATKLEYTAGDKLDLTGLVLEAKYSNGDTKILTEGFETDPVDMTTAGKKMVTVNFGGQKATFDITVNEPVVTDIHITTMPVKTVYYFGQELDLTNLVVEAAYANGAKKDVTSECTFSDVDMSTAGKKTVTITYKDQTVDLPIEVKAPNKTNLNETIKEAQKFVDDGTVDGLVESVKKLYLDTLAKAKEVAANESSTYAEVTDVQTKLMVCITTVNMQAGDKEALGSLIDSCKYFTDETLAANYVEAGQAEYKAALADANKVYADGDAFQENVDKVRGDLFNAVSALRMKANKSALQALLNQVNGIDLSLYTEESVALLHTAMENVNSVLANEALSVDDQATVDKAVKTLQAAVDGLQLKQTAETPETPADPTDPNKSTDPSDNSAGSESSKAGTTSKTSAKTGDAVPMAGAAVLVLAAGATAILIKRRKK